MPLTTFLADYGVLLVITIQTIIFGILYWKQNKIMEKQVSLTERSELRRTAFYTVVYLDYVKTQLNDPEMLPRSIYDIIIQPWCSMIAKGWEYFKRNISKLYSEKEANILEDLIFELKRKHYNKEKLPNKFKDKIEAQLDKIIDYLVYTYDIYPDYKEKVRYCIIKGDLF